MTFTADLAPGAAALTDRYPDLVVEHGANVQAGQVVGIAAEIGHEWLVRLLAERCYRRGAAFVDVSYFDPYVKRARLTEGAVDTLDFVPAWYGGSLLQLAEQRGARIVLRGTAHPEALVGVDPVRAGRDLLPAVAEFGRVIAARTVNWTLVPCPSPGWATLVRPDLDPEEAWGRLCEDIVHICRLDDPSPAASWNARFDELEKVAAALTARRFDALRFRGPGTDLLVGLLSTSRFRVARHPTVDGVVHMANLPSEEVFSAPDPDRVEGTVRATRPLAVGGSVLEDVVLEFRGGRAVRVDASTGADVLRGYIAKDPGAARLGEVALVDRSSRVGQMDGVFYETLIDENAASHIALGRAYGICVEDADRPRINDSRIHVDLMIGSPEVTVTGVGLDDREQAVLVDGRWSL